MRTYILQDTITVRGKSGATVTQSEVDWLDLEAHDDVTIWLELREVTPSTGASVILRIQTSPTKDEAFFNAANLWSPDLVTLTPGVQTPEKVLLASSNPALARYVRWQLTCTTADFDATMRIVVSASAPEG